MKKRNRKSKDKTAGPDWTHSFIKLGSRLLLAVLVVVVVLTISQCSVKEPQSPTWTTNMTVPVINRTYDMEEIISKIDQDEITMDDQGNIAYSVTEELDTVSLGNDNLSTSDLTYSVADSLGAVSIDPPSVDPVTVTFQEVTGLSPYFTSGTVPAMDFDVTNDLAEISNFTTATIATGTALVIITNDLGVALDQCDVSIYDASNSPATLVAGGSFPSTIAAGGAVDTLSLNLAGKTISNTLEVRADCHTPGGSVSNTDDRYIRTEMAFQNNLEVSAATAEVPQMSDLTFSQKVGLDLETGESIDTAGLSTGTLSLTVVNGTNLASLIEIQIPELKYGAASWWNLDTVLYGGDSVTVSTDLSDYELVPTSDTVNVNVTAHVPGSNGEKVQVSQNDAFRVSANLTSLSFDRVVGTFANSEASFEGIHQELEVPQGFSDVGLNSAVLTLQVDNAVDLPGSLDITLTGSNNKTLNLTGEIAARGTSQVARSTLTFDDVADFLYPLPEAIDVSGAISFGDGAYQGTITSDDFVAARVSIYAPMDIKIDSAEVNDIDLSKEEIEKDDIDAITDHVLNATFDYTITSHLPLGAAATLLMSGDSASLFLDDLATATHKVVSLESLQIDPAEVSLATGTGIVSEPVVSRGTIHLSNDDIQVLNTDTLYVRTKLVLTSSDTSGVKLTESDYMTINGQVNIEYEFDGEF